MIVAFVILVAIAFIYLPVQFGVWIVGGIILFGIFRGSRQPVKNKPRPKPGKHYGTANWDHLTD